VLFLIIGSSSDCEADILDQDLELYLAPAVIFVGLWTLLALETADASGDGRQEGDIVPSPCLPGWSGASIRRPSAAAGHGHPWRHRPDLRGAGLAEGPRDRSVRHHGRITVPGPRTWRGEDARPLPGGIEHGLARAAGRGDPPGQSLGDHGRDRDQGLT
jgi:hypothetical protein